MSKKDKAACEFHTFPTFMCEHKHVFLSVHVSHRGNERRRVNREYIN